MSPGDSATFLIYVILEIWVGDGWEGWGIAAMDDSEREKERERYNGELETNDCGYKLKRKAICW